jgi:FtsP/CotA-like multicopper oxidase with cupredoxin domain
MVRALLVIIAIILTAAPPSLAEDVYLVAKEFSQITNGGSPVTMWGFAQATAGFASVGAASSPGPVITVSPGDTVLNIYLRNDLPAGTGEPVSIVIPGQLAVMNPVWQNGRVTSFTHTAPPDGSTVATYTWNNLRAGTYAYHSGSHPGLQVHMGLYGALKMDAAPGQAYPGVNYDSEVLLFYNEIDSVLHDPTPVVAQPLTYKPDYFLINGKSFEVGDPNWLVGAANQNVLIRFINAGLKTHVPTLRGGYWSIVAEDGNPYMYPKEQYNVLLPAMKTMDVIWNPSVAGVYPVFDARHFLTDNQVSGGGMLVNLEVQCTGGSIFDVDNDGDVDIVDIQLVASRWNTAAGDPDYDIKYDLNNDGFINIVDIQMVAANWGWSGSGCL